MEFRNLDIIDVIGDVVDSMRTTGTFTNAVYSSPYTTFTVDNTLKAREIIDIGGTEYPVFNPTSTTFQVKANIPLETTYSTLAPYFMYGHILEIANTLTKMDASTQLQSFKKYPLIILQLDTPSTYNGLLNTFDYTDVRIYIANITDKDYKAADRRTNNFVPILYPLYEEFITKIQQSKSIRHSQIPNISHTKTDRFFWGTQLNTNSTNNILNDYLDAIEITDLQINVKNIKC